MRFLTLFLLTITFSQSFSQSDKLITVIQKGHAEVVKSVAYSPDGELIATGSRDKMAKLWDAHSGYEIRSFLGHEHTVNEVEFSPDGKLLATSSADGTAKLWEVETGKLIWTAPPRRKYITDVTFSPNGKWLLVGGYDWQLRIFDVKSGDTINTLKVNPDMGLGYGIKTAFSPDGKWLSVGEDNRAAKIYSTESWKLKYEFKPETGSCGGCATITDFSPDGTRLLKMSNKSPVEEYDLTTGKLIHTYQEEIKDFANISYNHDGTQMVVADEKSVWLYDTKTHKEIITFKADVVNINDVKFSPNGEEIAIAGDDNKVTFYDLKGNRRSTLEGILQQAEDGKLGYSNRRYWQSFIIKHIKYKNNLLLTKDSQYMIKGKSGTKAKMWEINSGKTNMQFIGHEKAVLCFDLNKDESELITAGGDGTVKRWNVKTGKEIHTYKGHREPVFDVTYSHDGTKFASASWDGLVIVWDLKSGEKLSVIRFQNVSAYNIAFTPNDVYLILGKLDKTLEMYEIDTQKKVRSFIGHWENITEILTGIGENQFLTTGKDGYAILWNMGTGLIERKFKHKVGEIYDALVINEGKVIVTAGFDRTIRFWNKKTGKIIKTLEGHQAEITSLNISENEKMLVSGDLDGVVKFWDLDKEEEFFENIHIGQNDWMAKTPDGYFTGTDGAIKNVHFVKGLKSYAADQFFDQFYQPQLLPSLFNSKDKDRQGNLQDMLKTSPPPKLKFGHVPDIEKDKIELHVKINNQGGGIKNLQLFHNGKRLSPNAIQLKKLKKESGYEIYAFTADVISGHNVFKAVAQSSKGISSAPAEVEVFSNSTVPGSKCHVLAIGINSYKNPKLSLNYARSDAVSFAENVKEYGLKIYKDVKLHQLYDKDATTANILKKLDELKSEISINDVFMFYYAGHGSVADEKFYFIPTEATRLYDAESLQRDAIEAGVLQEKLSHIKALKQLIIMDACQSGKSVELLAERGALEEKAISQLSRSSGIHVMASAGSEQFASEFGQLGHGLFTYLLLEAMNGKADGAPKDGKITIYELKSFLDDQVPEMSFKHKGKPQYPYTFSRGHDFPIGLLK